MIPLLVVDPEAACAGKRTGAKNGGTADICFGCKRLGASRLAWVRGHDSMRVDAAAEWSDARNEWMCANLIPEDK